MQKMYKPLRVGIVFAILAVMLTIFVSALYRMQIYIDSPVEDEQYQESTVLRTVTLNAARGNIYDRNGVLLASGRPRYNITMNRDALMEFSSYKRNEIIMELVYIAMDEGVGYYDTFPITMGAPFTYISDMTADQRTQLDKYIEFFSQLDPDISAPDLLAWMRGHYRIDYTTSITEARLIIGVRYEIEIRAIITNLAPYTFAYDVSTDFISIIEERGLTGVYIESGYIREYHTSNAAHLLGYIGQIPAEQFESYSKRGYPMDAMVGRDGVELAFEELLRGVNGKQIIMLTDTGQVMDVVTEVEPAPGRNIYLTIDISLQKAAEDILRMYIESMNLEREEEDTEKITGGAVVIIDVRTGELLAAASYPTFNRETLSQDYAMLASDPDRPMFNRAAMGRYSPGSTFKMVTGFTALRHGVVGRYTPINDLGVYDYYKDYKPSCWIYQATGHGHGELDIVQALTQSCNYFFIAASDMIEGGDAAGAEAIAQVAREFGLGISTGLEIPEDPGILATPENKKLFPGDKNWYRADTLQASFGQGITGFSPVQLANYAATIADGGVLHSLTILRKVVDANTSELLFTHEPIVLSEFEEKDFIEIIQEGMQLVTKSNVGTAHSVFGDYPINVAAKTGTVQSETQETNNGVFICYAPAEDPQIAISIVIEKGGSGSAVMDIARSVFDYYFGSEITAFTVPYGELIP